MTSYVQNGGGLATAAFTDFYTVPAAKDVRVTVRATNVTATDAYVYFEVVNPAGNATRSVGFNCKVKVGDPVDVFPGGLLLGEGWKLRHRASVAAAIDNFFSVLPAE